MGRPTLSAAAPTRCLPSCLQPSGWRGPSPGNLASAPLGCTVSCQHAWAQQGARCSPTPHCMSATPRKAGPGGLRVIPTQFWGSRVMARRLKTLQNKEGYLAGGGLPLPHPLTSASPPAPEPHGPPGWLERKAGSPLSMGIWGAPATLDPHAVGGSAKRSSSSPNGTSRDGEEDGEGEEDEEEK